MALPVFPVSFSSRKLIYALDVPTFQRDFAGLKTLDHGTGPAITFTRNSNATYFDATGTLQTAGSNVPRFDHDPVTGESRGLLIEEARTNNLANSQMSGAVAGSPGTTPTGWGIITTSNGLSRQSIATGTINGFQYIDVRVTGTATATFGFRLDPQATSAGYSASSGQAWTSSCYFALIAGSAPTNFELSITERDSSNVALASTSIAFSSVGSSLDRHILTRMLSDAGTAKVTTDIRANVANGEVVDFTLRIAAPQLERGAFATSYIPTTTAAATRALDNARVTPISSFYNQEEGTLFHETSVYAETPTPTVFQIDDGSQQNRIFIGARVSATSTVAITITLGSAQFGRDENLITGTHKVCSAFKNANFAVSTNGATVATANSGTMPSELTHARIGSNISALNTCHIRKIAYWPKRLSNTLLEQITT